MVLLIMAAIALTIFLLGAALATTLHENDQLDEMYRRAQAMKALERLSDD